MAQEVVIMTPEQVEVRFELAGIGSRFIAMLVDTLLQTLLGLVVGVLLALFGVVWMAMLETASTWVLAIIVILLFIILGGYFLFFEATRNGQTPGKMFAGIRVILDSGHPIDFRAALLRNVMRLVDSLPGTYGIGIVSVFFSPQYRRLGDYVAGTLVVKVGQTPVSTPTQPASAPVGYSATEPASTVLPAEALPYISRITKDDYRAVRLFLNRVPQLDGHVAHNLAVNLVQPLAKTLELIPAQIGDPIAFLEAISSEYERRVIH